MNPADIRTIRRAGNHTFDSSNTRYNIERILAALIEPKTYAQLSEMLHMSDRSVRRYVARLRSEPNRRARVKSYLVIGGYHCLIFALGSKPDFVWRMQTPSEKNAKWRAKVKASPDLIERRRRHEVARWAVKKAIKAPQNWASALLGAAAREVRT